MTDDDFPPIPESMRHEKPIERTNLAKMDEALANNPPSVRSVSRQDLIDEAKARNAVTKAIRGTLWGKDSTARVIAGVAEYARVNGLDAVRHIEVLGGKIYLVGEFYLERAAPLYQRGVLVPIEPEYIHRDPRIDALLKSSEPTHVEWATMEQFRRMQQRILFAAPEEAKAICIYRVQIAATGQILSGVNWAGGVRGRTKKDPNRWADPVGEENPTTTSFTRAARRCLRQLIEVLPEYGSVVRVLEERAVQASEAIVATEISSAPLRPPSLPMQDIRALTDAEHQKREAREGELAALAGREQDPEMELELRRQAEMDREGEG